MHLLVLPYPPIPTHTHTHLHTHFLIIDLDFLLAAIEPKKVEDDGKYVPINVRMHANDTGEALGSLFSCILNT